MEPTITIITHALHTLSWLYRFRCRRPRNVACANTTPRLSVSYLRRCIHPRTEACNLMALCLLTEYRVRAKKPRTFRCSVIAAVFRMAALSRSKCRSKFSRRNTRPVPSWCSSRCLSKIARQISLNAENINYINVFEPEKWLSRKKKSALLFVRLFGSV